MKENKENILEQKHNPPVRVVIAIVHYEMSKGMNPELKDITLHLRSLYEVAAIPDYLDRLESTDVSMGEYTFITSMHIYDKILPLQAVNFSLYNPY